MIDTFKIFEPFTGEIIHGVTEADEGSFTNAEDFMKKTGLSRPIFANQVHKDTIVIVDEKTPEDLIPDADAFITKTRGRPLMIKVADCQGILIYDPIHHVIGAVHSGWKGSAQNILGKTIAKMQKELGADPEEMRIGISPSLGPCCAEFTDPRNELPAFCHKYIKDGNKVDFWALSVEQAMLQGVPKEQIENKRICTKDDLRYFSYRRGDTQNRMAVFITLR